MFPLLYAALVPLAAAQSSGTFTLDTADGCIILSQVAALSNPVSLTSSRPICPDNGETVNWPLTEDGNGAASSLAIYANIQDGVPGCVMALSQMQAMYLLGRDLHWRSDGLWNNNDQGLIRDPTSYEVITCGIDGIYLPTGFTLPDPSSTKDESAWASSYPLQPDGGYKDSSTDPQPTTSLEGNPSFSASPSPPSPPSPVPSSSEETVLGIQTSDFTPTISPISTESATITSSQQGLASGDAGNLDSSAISSSSSTENFGSASDPSITGVTASSSDSVLALTSIESESSRSLAGTTVSSSSSTTRSTNVIGFVTSTTSLTTTITITSSVKESATVSTTTRAMSTLSDGSSSNDDSEAQSSLISPAPETSFSSGFSSVYSITTFDSRQSDETETINAVQTSSEVMSATVSSSSSSPDSTFDPAPTTELDEIPSPTTTSSALSTTDSVSQTESTTTSEFVFTDGTTTIGQFTLPAPEPTREAEEDPLEAPVFGPDGQILNAMPPKRSNFEGHPETNGLVTP